MLPKMRWLGLPLCRSWEDLRLQSTNGEKLRIHMFCRWKGNNEINTLQVAIMSACFCCTASFQSQFWHQLRQFSNCWTFLVCVSSCCATSVEIARKSKTAKSIQIPFFSSREGCDWPCFLCVRGALQIRKPFEWGLRADQQCAAQFVNIHISEDRVPCWVFMLPKLHQAN